MYTEKEAFQQCQYACGATKNQYKKQSASKRTNDATKGQSSATPIRILRKQVKAGKIRPKKDTDDRVLTFNF